MSKDKKPLSEVEALAKIERILEQLDTAKRKRVLEFLTGAQ